MFSPRIRIITDPNLIQAQDTHGFRVPVVRDSQHIMIGLGFRKSWKHAGVYRKHVKIT
jgi:hypothetical protein